MYMNSLIEFLKNAITCVNIQSFTHLLLGFNEDLNFTNVESIVFSGRLRIFISTYLPTAPEAQYIDIRYPLSAGPL